MKTSIKEILITLALQSYGVLTGVLAGTYSLWFSLMLTPLLAFMAYIHYQNKLWELEYEEPGCES